MRTLSSNSTRTFWGSPRTSDVTGIALGFRDLQARLREMAGKPVRVYFAPRDGDDMLRPRASMVGVLDVAHKSSRVGQYSLLLPAADGAHCSGYFVVRADEFDIAVQLEDGAVSIRNKGNGLSIVVKETD